MFRIGEFSKLTQITVRMLRYYDKEGLLKPAEVDPISGYRLYSAGQIPVLNRIRFLRDAGFQVGEISRLLEGWSDDAVAESLALKSVETQRNIQLEQEKLNRLHMARESIMQKKSQIHYDVVMKSIPGYLVLSLRKVIPNYYEEAALWKELSDFVHSRSLSVSSDTFSIYHDTEYKEENVDVELCVQVEEVGEGGELVKYRWTEPVETMASMMVYGDFSNIAGAYLSLAGWLQKSGKYEMGGQSRQIVHRGPWNERDPDQYVVEIQIPLKDVKPV